ncbi:multidrug transporter [Photobacterium kishitanii]|uniref:EamA family transporter n=1 Tax=Photobacterium kishitanii TaxID=318456 RepID=UPI0005D309FD|nr:EamA family transporter [Photobacterium kishitanii]KJG10156.1 multidrug transporter [Photobacterium kishitanii]PSV06897.1 multidrug transporter [Photobacterium kishitanii]PSV78083.1 multidrug transporter [Photobacterium kishitanii]
MTHFAILLVIFSSLLHAGWNILGKKNTGSSLAFALAASSTISLLLLPYLIWFLSTIGINSLPANFWYLAILTGIAQTVYIMALVTAYQYADIGVIYPIIRALPVLMVAIATTLLGQPSTWLQWLGFGLITIGCVVIPLQRFNQFNIRAYFNKGMFWSLIAALGTTAYSVIDKSALTIITHIADPILANQYSALFYLGIQFMMMLPPLLVCCCYNRNLEPIIQAWQIKYSAGLAGIIMGITYCLVLLAMTTTANVSMVVALRQISIVFGLIMGVLFLGEKWYLTRTIGVSLILLGLIASLGLRA